jgi:hypothetical protein
MGWGDFPRCNVGPVDPLGLLDHLGLPTETGHLLVQWTYAALVNRGYVKLEKVIEQLQAAGLPDAVIVVALQQARNDGYDVPRTTFEEKASAPQVYTGSAGDGGADNLGDVDTPTLEEARAHMDLLESKFIAAEISGDAAAMEAIITAAAALIISLLKGVGKMRQRKLDLEIVREELLRNSPNIARHVRHLSARELRELRDAPTPDPRTGRRTPTRTRITPRRAPARK